MRLLIAAIGRLRTGPDAALYAHYAQRIDQAGRGVALGPLATVELRESALRTPAERKDEEAAALTARVPSGAQIWALDETGEMLSSAAFAASVGKLRDGGAETLVFLIGGPDGHGAHARLAASRIIALSRLTLPHGLARIVLAEQLYRAAAILGGHPYHRA